MVGIAAAPDFTQWGYTPAQKAELAAGRTILSPTLWPRADADSPRFWADGQANRLLEGEIALDCPVRLLHGLDDADVPLPLRTACWRRCVRAMFSSASSSTATTG
jgi:pimeloyl-ACP methyl ester carboxylesterase